MDYTFMTMVENLKLDRSWLKENATSIVPCEKCGRWLTPEEFEKHKEGV